MTTITEDSAEFATFPKTIRELITETIAKGGEVVQDAPRLISFYLPSWARGVNRDNTPFRTCRQRQIGTVGWYVRDGRNKIGATAHDVRDALSRRS